MKKSTKSKIKTKLPKLKLLAYIVSRKQLSYLASTRLDAKTVKKREKGLLSTEEIKSILQKRYKHDFDRLLGIIRGEESLHQASEDVVVDVAFCYYAYGFQPDEYVGFSLAVKDSIERRSYLSDRDRRLLNAGLNDFFARVSVGHKDKSYSTFRRYYGRDVLFAESCTFAEFRHFAKNHERFFLKDPLGAEAEGMERVETAEISDLKGYYSRNLKGTNAVLEEEIVQCDDMALFNASSVNTIRVSCLVTQDEVKPIQFILRVGRAGSFADNASTGGLFASIDGRTGKVVTTGFNSSGESYVSHPDTGTVFEGSQIPDWSGLLKLVEEISTIVPNIHYVSWDLAHTASGWVIVEGNEAGRVRMTQIANRSGVKREICDLVKRIDAPLAAATLKALEIG